MGRADQHALRRGTDIMPPGDGPGRSLPLEHRNLPRTRRDIRENHPGARTGRMDHKIGLQYAPAFPVTQRHPVRPGLDLFDIGLDQRRIPGQLGHQVCGFEAT